jgi:hypothetical protein
MVPATPNFEVTNAAVVEASPAANTWLPLITGVLCPSALFTNPTLSMTPLDYKGLQITKKNLPDRRALASMRRSTSSNDQFCSLASYSIHPTSWKGNSQKFGTQKNK